MASKLLKVKLARMPELLKENPGLRVWVESECLGILVITPRMEVLRAAKVFPEREVMFWLTYNERSGAPRIVLQTPGSSHGAYRR